MKATERPKLSASLTESERRHLWEIKMGRKFLSEYVPELYKCRTDWERGFDANMRADGITSYRDLAIKPAQLQLRKPNTMKLYNFIATAVVLTFASCSQESDVAAFNVSAAAHNFEVNRRAIFYNGITGDYILTVEGLLSVKESSSQNRLEVIVKTGPKSYKKHYLGLSDNVTYFVEQLETVAADPYHYRVIFRPQTIIPDVEVQGN